MQDEELRKNYNFLDREVRRYVDAYITLSVIMFIVAILVGYYHDISYATLTIIIGYSLITQMYIRIIRVINQRCDLLIKMVTLDANTTIDILKKEIEESINTGVDMMKCSVVTDDYSERLWQGYHDRQDGGSNDESGE